MSTVCLCTLVLNEMEWLPRLYEQHKQWPGLLKWVFVESADQKYAEANPSLVSSGGLSVDGTSEYLRQLSETDSNIQYIPYGFATHCDPAEGKCAARQQYLDAIESIRPDFLITLDADEFYTHLDQHRVLEYMRSTLPIMDGCIFHRRDIWRPPSIVNHPLFELEVVGGFWQIACCHWWKWSPGIHYTTSHNTPAKADGSLMQYIQRYSKSNIHPQMIHLGFAASKDKRLAKNRYYQARGEGVTDDRLWYVQSRAAFETWTPGKRMPHRATVVPYKGRIPEVFQR